MSHTGRRKGLLNAVVDLLFDEGARFFLHEVVLAFRSGARLAFSVHDGLVWSDREGDLHRWFVLYGLDRVGWLALFLGLCRCVDDLESK